MFDVIEAGTPHSHVQTCKLELVVSVDGGFRKPSLHYTGDMDSTRLYGWGREGGRSIERAGSVNDVGIGWGARAYKRVYS